jgi:hypothetical protein
MAALLFKTSEDLESRATDIKLPVMTGLEVCSFFDTSLGKAVKNLAPGKADLTLVGAPTVADNRVGVTSNSAYFQTSCAETASCTLIVVARLTSAGTATATRPMLISTYQDAASASGFGANILAISTSSGFQATAGLTDSAAPARQNWLASPASGVTPTNWTFIYNIVSTTSISSGSKTAAVTATDNTPSGVSFPRVVSGRNFRIGGSYNTGYGGTADLAFAAIYSTALTGAEVTSIYDWLDPILAARSTPIAI